MSDCIFCRIASGEVGAKMIWQDGEAVAFHDLNPQAPIHALVIPRRHLGSLDDSDAVDAALFGHLLVAAAEVARLLGVAASGYRVVTNVGADGGQSVAHLHLHVLGGRSLGWPPG